MNIVQNLINQQLGFSKRKKYDGVFYKLRCGKIDEYKYIPPFDDTADSTDTPIFACKFAQKEGNEHLLALANEDGKIAIHNTDTRERHGEQAHFNAIFDLAWMFQQMKIVTVSGDHTAKLFDVSNSRVHAERMFSGHTRSIKTIAVSHSDTSTFATGGRDGTIIVWDTRAKSQVCACLHDCQTILPEKVIHNSHHVTHKVITPKGKTKKNQLNTISGANSVTGLVFRDVGTLVSCGAGDGAIKVWDLRKSYTTYKSDPIPKCVIPYAGGTARNGFSNLIIDPGGIKLYANCLDNVIYCYNIGACDPEPVMKYTGHQNSTFFIKSALSADGSYLMSGSTDHYAYIWDTKEPLPFVRLAGHNAEVTCVAWKQRGNITLVTCSDDIKHKVWTVDPETPVGHWDLEDCGRAENLKEQLSTKLKRALEVSELPNGCKKKIILQCNRCHVHISDSPRCENCVSAKRKSPEAMTNCNKRLQTEKGPRRLFSVITSNVPESEPLAKELDNCDKSHSHKNPPVDNLPNFAIDGTAPHLRYSPQKRRDRDWLTKLRVEKGLIREMQQLAEPSPPKMPKIDSSPRRRKPASNERCASPQSPLLRFFRITNNSVKCDNLVKPPCNGDISQATPSN